MMYSCSIRCFVLLEPDVRHRGAGRDHRENVLFALDPHFQQESALGSFHRGDGFCKFLAAFGVYFIANTLALLPAITMGFFSSAFPWGILFGNYIGTLLYGAAMISIGVFISGLTISQVIAAIGTFVIAIFLMFVDQIASALSGNFIGTILTWISFTSRYDTFTQGIFSVSSCVYFISVAAVFVFLTARRGESRPWN